MCCVYIRMKYSGSYIMSWSSLSPNHNLNALKSTLSLLEKTLPVVGIRFDYPGHDITPIVQETIRRAVHECLSEIKWNEVNVFPVTLRNSFDAIIGRYPDIWNNGLEGWGYMQRDMIDRIMDMIQFNSEEAKCVFSAIFMTRILVVAHVAGFNIELMSGLRFWIVFNYVVVWMHFRVIFDYQ